jgi:anti-sigma factor RsiW
MDELIQKYLDGELSEEEAAAFTEALSSDPALEAELETFEQTLALVAKNTAREPSAAFTDAVIDRVAASSARAGADHGTHSTAARRGTRGLRAWLPRLAWAAVFAVVFALGFFSAGQIGGVSVPEGPDAPGTAVSDGVPTQLAESTGQSPATTQLRLVRLVYVPSDQDIEQVTVAGTFNGWDPEVTALRKEGGVWIAQLVLSPETYEYMFVEDGETWVTDPLAMQTRDDGFGRKNAVLDLTL